MKRFAAVFALALVAAPAGVAFAAEGEPTVEQIRAAEVEFTKGRDSYKIGAYAEAAEHFESADLAAPNPKVVELAILAREKAGHLDRAATDVQLAVERHPDVESLRTIAERILPKARAELLQVEVECNEACTLLDGSRLVHGAPSTKRVVYVSPGAHTIRAGWSHDRAEAKEVSGEAGGTAAVSFTAPPIPETPPEARPGEPGGPGYMERERPPEKPTGMSPVVFFIGAGLTAAVGGVAVWSGIDTVNDPGVDKVEAACDDPARRAECNDLYNEGNDKELRTNILLGATGALALGTVVIGAFFTNWSGEPTEDVQADKVSVTPWLNVANGATLGASGRF